MVTLGIDASSSKTGWAVVNDACELLGFGEIDLTKFKTKKNPLEYLLVTYNEITKICAEYQPNQVCVEEIFNRNVGTFRTLARVRGVVEVACLNSGITKITAFNASHMRKAVLNHGSLDKAQICTIFEERFNMPLATEGYDQSDAILVALCGASEPEKKVKHATTKRRKTH